MLAAPERKLLLHRPLPLTRRPTAVSCGGCLFPLHLQVLNDANLFETVDAVFVGAPPFPPVIPAPSRPQAPTDLHMLDFRELELLGDEGGVW